MPVMDGYTATRMIRSKPAWATLPILAMTANAMAGDKEKVIEAGMNDHIAKPLNIDDMFATLVKWIRPTGSVSASAQATAGEAAVETRAEPAAGTEAPPPSSPTLPEIPGVDLKAGLATCMNNEDLYLRLLTKFRDGQQNFAALFAAALADSDTMAATRCAHTLKGTAGNIGAKGVQNAAAELEHACNTQQDRPEIDRLLAKTLAELDPVISALHGLTTDVSPDTTATASVDIDQSKSLLDRLDALLRDSDAEAADLIEELLPLLKGSSMSAGFKQVANAIAAYDYDAALEQLVALRRSAAK